MRIVVLGAGPRAALATRALVTERRAPVLWPVRLRDAEGAAAQCRAVRARPDGAELFSLLESLSRGE